MPPQARKEKGHQGNSSKPLAFQLGKLKLREGTPLAQGHTAGIFMPLLPQALPLWH